VRRGKKKAVVTVGRSILVIVWYLLYDEGAQFHDLGVDHYNSRINPDRKKRNHIREPGDVDVLVIGGPPGRDLRRANARMEEALDIPVQITTVSSPEWVAAESGFLHEVQTKPSITLDLTGSREHR
jgi:hypothetical protein